MSQIDAIALVRAHGRAASSFQSLAPGLRHWFDEAREACVAYTEVGDAWVTVGSGLAAHEREHEVMEAFARAAKARGKRVRFFASERELPHDSSLAALQIGELPVWDPRQWPDSLSSRMRGQLRRDRKNARATVRLATHAELADARSATRRGIDALIAHWLDSRKIAPMGFLVDVDPWHLSHERRFFVAEQQGAVVAALIAIPVPARDGWFLETMLRAPSAANGTVELLFDLAMQTFAAEGSPYLTFGMCPLSGADWPLLKWARRASSGLYNYEGLRKFKGKLGPASWEPLYLVYPKGDHALSALWDAGRAFMPGGLLAFAWSSAIQRTQEMVRWLAYATMIGTCGYAWLAQPTYSAPSARLAQGTLDVLMVAGLLVLSKSPRRPGMLAVSALAMLDFVVSCLLLAADGESHVTGLWHASSVGLAMLWPLMISLFLFASRDRERRYAPDAAAQDSALAHGFALNNPAAGEGDL